MYIESASHCITTVHLSGCVRVFVSSTLGMKSRARVTVVVTWVCVKDSSSIQSGWSDGNMNLGGARKTEEKHFHSPVKYNQVWVRFSTRWVGWFMLTSR